jgi:hypothetical protein
MLTANRLEAKHIPSLRFPIFHAIPGDARFLLFLRLGRKVANYFMTEICRSTYFQGEEKWGDTGGPRPH